MRSEMEKICRSIVRFIMNTYLNRMKKFLKIILMTFFSSSAMYQPMPSAVFRTPLSNQENTFHTIFISIGSLFGSKLVQPLSPRYGVSTTASQPIEEA